MIGSVCRNSKNNEHVGKDYNTVHYKDCMQCKHIGDFCLVHAKNIYIYSKFNKKCFYY